MKKKVFGHINCKTCLLPSMLHVGSIRPWPLSTVCLYGVATVTLYQALCLLVTHFLRMFVGGSMADVSAPLPTGALAEIPVQTAWQSPDNTVSADVSCTFFYPLASPMI
jgi:hypothetical protein